MLIRWQQLHHREPPRSGSISATSTGVCLCLIKVGVCLSLYVSLWAYLVFWLIFHKPGFSGLFCNLWWGVTKCLIWLFCVLLMIGGKLVYQTTKNRASGPKCPVTGKRIQGVWFFLFCLFGISVSVWNFELMSNCCTTC